MGLGRPLQVWAVSDGRAGIENQTLGLAETLARLTPAEIVVKRIAWRGWIGRLPWWAVFAPLRRLTQDSAIAPPWPDVWIGCGRATLPLSMRVRRWSKGRTFVVQVQDPKTPLKPYDLVIPPRHDGLEGANVLAVTGSPHRVTPEKIAAEYEPFRAEVDRLPGPRAAVLVGGKSRNFDLSAKAAGKMAASIRQAVEHAGGSIMLTFSRRTPAPAKAAMKATLEGVRGIFWDGEGPNPYFAFLAGADFILVTEDSTNMAAEAAATGKPVYVLAMEGRPGKFASFHEDLRARGAARPFEGTLEHWTYEPLRETERAAREILSRLPREAR